MSRHHGTVCQRQCSSFATKLSSVGASEDWLSASVGCRHPVIICKVLLMVNEVGVSTVVPDTSVLLCCLVDQGWGGCLQRCCSNNPARASKPPQECDA